MDIQNYDEKLGEATRTYVRRPPPVFFNALAAVIAHSDNEGCFAASDTAASLCVSPAQITFTALRRCWGGRIYQSKIAASGPVRYMLSVTALFTQ